MDSLFPVYLLERDQLAVALGPALPRERLRMAGDRWLLPRKDKGCPQHVPPTELRSLDPQKSFLGFLSLEREDLRGTSS